jgi:calcineurin-like phosphoesterase family protein
MAHSSRVAVICLVPAFALAILVARLVDSGSGRAHSPPQQRTFRYRYMYDSSSAPKAVARHGWNLLDVGSHWEADRLPRGTRGLVWVGDYDNSTCNWELSDAQVRHEIKRGDPKVAGYVISDEPDPKACPDAPAQHRARSRMIHSLDPGKLTVMVMDANSGKASLDQIPRWVGVTDYVGLDPYPCYQGRACKYSWISTIIRAADRTGLRYWGVVQAFADPPWRWPTPAEESHMLSQWAASRASGYMTFAWKWRGSSLGARPALLAALTRFNRARPVKSSAPRLPVAQPAAGRPREVHYTFTGPRSVAFDWVGGGSTIRYGRGRAYGARATAHAPRPLPFSSKGPFREARLGGLQPATTYHYSIGGGGDHTFTTAPKAPYRFDVEADVGDSGSFGGVLPTQHQIASDHPAFVLVPGDLTYANDDGQHAADRHFNDVMAWSQTAAYMPAWGNHEWDESSDDLRNYKGRFAIPHPHGSPGAPGKNCCGEDWGWFDAGGVRFISYPEPYSDRTWQAWRPAAAQIMAAAQNDPRINFIVTFGHRPAYSTGYHPGDSSLAGILNSLGDRYSKYVLNMNGHSHDYERFQPIHHVVHVTVGGGGAELEPWSSGPDPRTAFRAMHLEHLRVTVTAQQLQVQDVCGPSSSHDEMKCRAGQVIDSFTIAR